MSESDLDQLVARMGGSFPQFAPIAAAITALRASVAERDRRIAELEALLIESQSSIGGDWRARRDAAILKGRQGVSLSAEELDALSQVLIEELRIPDESDIAIWIAAKNWAFEQAAKVCETEQRLWLAEPNDEQGISPVCHPAQTCYELALEIRRLKDQHG